MVSVLSCDARQRAIVASSLVRWFVFSRVIFILFFWVELVVGLFPSDVKTLSDCRPDVNTIAYFVLLLP